MFSFSGFEDKNVGWIDYGFIDESLKMIMKMKKGKMEVDEER